MNAGTCIQALIGGALLGTSASVLLALEGTAEGVSGMAGRVFSTSPRQRTSRIAFLLGLVATGFVWRVLLPGAFASHSPRALGTILVAGVLVGFGARLANGCTSGHGILGVSRFSRRSAVATIAFCTAAIATVALLSPGDPS